MLGNGDVSRYWLAAHLELDQGEEVETSILTLRLLELREFTASLKGLTIKELGSVIFLAFERFGTDNDGIVSEGELRQTTQELILPLNDAQLERLVGFLYSGGDGVVMFSEWMAGVGALGEPLRAHSPEHRLEVDVAGMGWIVLDELMTVARELYQEVRESREKRRAGASPRRTEEAGGRARKKLREREPW